MCAWLLFDDQLSALVPNVFPGLEGNALPSWPVPCSEMQQLVQNWPGWNFDVKNIFFIQNQSHFLVNGERTYIQTCKTGSFARITVPAWSGGWGFTGWFLTCSSNTIICARDNLVYYKHIIYKIPLLSKEWESSTYPTAHNIPDYIHGSICFEAQSIHVSARYTIAGVDDSRAKYNCRRRCAF